MGILLISRLLPYHRFGGMEKFGLELAENLIKKGHKVEMLTQKNNFKSGIPQIQINLPNLGFSFNRELFIRLANKKIKKKYDLIFSNCICNLPKNQKVVYYMHGIAPDLVFKEPRFLFKKYIFYQEKNMIKNSNKVLIPTNSLKNKAIETYKMSDEKIKVIPYGINIPEYKKKKIDKIKILFVGTLSKRKGFDNFLLMTKRIEFNVEFLVAGDGPLKYHLNKFKDKRIKYLGVLNRREINDLYSKSDILVVPSLFEGLPFVLLEAMSFKLPVVCNNFYGVNELVKNGENSFVANSLSGLVGHTQLLIENKNLRRRIGENAFNTIKMLNWKNVIKLYEKIFEETCK